MIGLMPTAPPGPGKSVDPPHPPRAGGPRGGQARVGEPPRSVTTPPPPPQLLVGRIQETEFDRHTEPSCGLALLVALRSSPETPFEDDRGSQHQEPLRKLPECR